jgi:hypothetical protein
VRFPWGPLPMGTSPVYRRGDTVATPVRLAGGPVVVGGRREVHSRLSAIPGTGTVSEMDRAPNGAGCCVVANPWVWPDRLQRGSRFPAVVPNASCYGIGPNRN